MSSTQHYEMTIDGMTCSDCEFHISQALALCGAEDIHANFHRGEATFVASADVAYHEARLAVEKIGYHVVGIRQNQSFPVQEVLPNPAFDYDLVIVGSGSAAFAAAIEARGAGARVAIIERDTLGGTCVNVGCIPSKALLRAAEVHHQASHNPFLGLRTSAERPDLSTLVKEKDALVNVMRQEKYANLIREYHIDLISGEARFLDDQSLVVGDRIIKGDRYIIATGARPHIPRIAGLADIPYMTSTSILNLSEPPRHLIVIGSGYIAMELGQLFRRLGSKVTLIQRGKELMPTYDVEVREVITKMLNDAKINIISGAQYQRVAGKAQDINVVLTVKGREQVIHGDALLVAAGRDANIEALNLSAARVDMDVHNQPLFDAHLKTSNPRIYLAGDVTLGPQFVYVAAYEGKIAAQNALGLTPSPATLNLEVVPTVTFTQPAIASVGLTQGEAEHQGIPVKSSILPLSAVPRALVNRDTQGVIKLVAEIDTGRIRGAQVVAENAGDLIYSMVLAINHRLTITDLTNTLAPYLTMSEGLKLAALGFDTDITKLSCCAG